MTAALTFTHVTRTEKGAAAPLLQDVSFEAAEGELTALVGADGAGKTTLMRIAAGILAPQTGAVSVLGETIRVGGTQAQLLIGYMPQKFGLYEDLSVMENFLLYADLFGLGETERQARFTELLAMTDLTKFTERPAGKLSGGMKQKLGLACALLNRPKLLLLDEPLSNLDARLRLEMREEIRRIQQRTGVTTIFVTHDQEEALSISDRIVLMRSGVLQQNDLPQRLYNEPANQFVADFLGNPPINNIPGSIQNGLFVTEDGKAEAKLAMLEGVENGRKVNFSVRSESFVLDEKGPIACEVTRMYQMGKEEMAYLRMGGHDFRAYIDADAGLKAGDHVRLGLKKRGVFLFDRETGERIR